MAGGWALIEGTDNVDDNAGGHHDSAIDCRQEQEEETRSKQSPMREAGREASCPAYSSWLRRSESADYFWIAD